jgi:hypothetical protein
VTQGCRRPDADSNPCTIATPCATFAAAIVVHLGTSYKALIFKRIFMFETRSIAMCA